MEKLDGVTGGDGVLGLEDDNLTCEGRREGDEVRRRAEDRADAKRWEKVSRSVEKE